MSSKKAQPEKIHFVILALCKNASDGSKYVCEKVANYIRANQSIKGRNWTVRVLKVKNQYQAIAEKLEGLKLPKKNTKNFIIILGPLPTKSINVVIDLEGNRAGYTTVDTLGSTPQNNAAVGDRARRKSDIGKALMTSLKLPKAEVKVFERPGKTTSHFALYHALDKCKNSILVSFPPPSGNFPNKVMAKWVGQMCKKMLNK